MSTDRLAPIGCLCPGCDHGFEPDHLGDLLCDDCQHAEDEASYLTVEEKRRALLPICERRTHCRGIAKGHTQAAPGLPLVRTCDGCAALAALELHPFTTTERD